MFKMSCSARHEEKLFSVKTRKQKTHLRILTSKGEVLRKLLLNSDRKEVLKRIRATHPDTSPQRTAAVLQAASSWEGARK